MARKLAHGTQSNRSAASSGPPPGDGVGRRTCLRLGAAAVATFLSVVGRASASAAADPDDHTLRIRGSGTASTYELTVGGELAPAAGSAADADARISECAAEGAVATGDRRYRFSGPLRDLRVDGDATVTVDGVEVR
jgi:hypothetical protein